MKQLKVDELGDLLKKGLEEHSEVRFKGRAAITIFHNTAIGNSGYSSFLKYEGDMSMRSLQNATNSYRLNLGGALFYFNRRHPDTTGGIKIEDRRQTYATNEGFVAICLWIDKPFHAEIRLENLEEIFY